MWTDHSRALQCFLIHRRSASLHWANCCTTSTMDPRHQAVQALHQAKTPIGSKVGVANNEEQHCDVCVQLHHHHVHNHGIVQCSCWHEGTGQFMFYLMPSINYCGPLQTVRSTSIFFTKINKLLYSHCRKVMLHREVRKAFKMVPVLNARHGA